MRNPFYDVFNLYYHNQADEAKRLLRQLMDNPEYHKQALINYGLLFQREGAGEKAGRMYMKALGSGERLSLIYLCSLYGGLRDKALTDAVDKCTVSHYWVDYERGVYYLTEGNSELGITYLKKAVDKGFFAVSLFQIEPVFNAVRGRKGFKEIAAKAQSNSVKREKLLQIVGREEGEFMLNRPYAVSGELYRASLLERRKNFRAAEAVLSGIINSRVSFKERSVALFWMARIMARIGNRKQSRKYLLDFVNHLMSDEKDSTGYKELVREYCNDIIQNDIYLRRN